MSDGAARVLETLREAGGRPCSGGALAEALGVTRAQIRELLEALRRRGDEIAGTPGGGYRLGALPDRLYPEEIQAGLATRWLARPIAWLDASDSTFRVAGARARAGARQGPCIVAVGQTAGGPPLGLVATRFSTPAALAVSALLSAPSLLLYLRAIRRGSVGTLASDQVDAHLPLDEDGSEIAEIPEGPSPRASEREGRRSP